MPSRLLWSLLKKTGTIAVLVCSIWLGGCAYVTHFPSDKIPDRSGSIVPGRTESEAVHATLGSPFIASGYWGFDLYRDASSQTEVPAALFVPYAVIKDDIFRYTLVSYDKDRLAESIATGIYRRPSDWRVASPIESDYLSLHLQAGDFTFVVEQDDRQETLLASSARRDAFLERARLSSQCTAVVGCGTRACSDTLQMDGGGSMPLPCRLKQYDTVAALGFSPGSHTLKASGGRWQQNHLSGSFSGEQSVSFSCGEGEVLYIVIDVSAKEYTRWGAKGAEWRIDLHKEMPDLFRDRPLLLYRAGQWFVDPEPTDR